MNMARPFYEELHLILNPRIHASQRQSQLVSADQLKRGDSTSSEVCANGSAAPKHRNETGDWWRRHDEYDKWKQ